MDDQSPIISDVECERPDTCEPEDMWDSLVDLCETDADLDAVIAMRDEAEGCT